ncbi:SpiroCoCo family coiled-coil protein [Leptospira sp. GIMC2001]|uniref:SpiroCoCo family coiled-coil protein n=1 Tax=Leptospira sp. GIMC2001 TaxID=1513297 RepID=UPI0023494F38|nr:hypothetical protein [Leptospira sp. GIMC2001]WCL48428.1 hypothetical protein O4O04_14100 [Leptospira sp. GIMC2001]
MGLEILIPFLASVAVTIGLRRLDKSNTKLSQIKRYATKLSEEINQTAVLKVQSVKDAGIDLEIHLKQARKTSEDIQKLSRESKELFENLKSSRDYLSSLSQEMTAIVELASDAKKESEYLQRSLDEVSNHRSEIGYLREDMDSLREESVGILDMFQEKLNLRSDDMLQSLAQKLIELESLMEKKSDALDVTLEDIAESAKTKINQESDALIKDTVGRIDMAKRELDDVMDRVVDTENNLEIKISKFEDTSAILSEKVDRFEERLEEKTSKAQIRIEEKISGLERKLSERFDRIIEQASQSKETFLDGIKFEVDAIKREIEGLSLETMTRRDDILNETRRQAENINTSILEFQEKYLEAENKLLKQADSRKSELMRQIESFAEEFRSVSGELRADAESIRKETLGELKSFHKDLEVTRSLAETDSKEAVLNLRQDMEARIRSDLGDIETRINSLDTTIASKLGEVDTYVDDIKDVLTDTAREILDEAESKANRFEDMVASGMENSEKKIESMISYWDEEMKKARERVMDNLNGLEDRIKGIHIQGSDLLDKFSSEYEDNRKRLDDYLQAQEGSLEKESKRAQDDLSSKFQILKKTAEDFFSRQELKVDKLNENIDTRINKQLAKLVDKGNLHLGQIEEKVQKHITSLKKDLDDSFKSNKEEFRRFRTDIEEGIQEALQLKEDILGSVSGSLVHVKDEVEDLTSKIQNAKDEMRSIEETKILFERSETVSNRLSKFLEDFDSNAYLLENYISSVDSLTELKNQTEEDVINLKNELAAISGWEEKTSNLENHLATIGNETLSLRESLNQMVQWESRIEKALDSSETLKESLDEIQETRNSLERIQHIQKEQEATTEELQNKIESIDREIELIATREQELNESIRQADARSKHLIDREKDILTVESRFDKIESLIGDLADRHRQALTLQKRVEELRDEANISKEELESLINEADEKFEKLSGFLDIVQNTISSETQKKIPKGKGSDPLLERKKNTVLSLYDKHHWTPESISDKLGIEKSLVDTILASRKAR